MNSNVPSAKVKILVQALVITLLAAQTNAVLRTLLFSDCEEDSWRLFNIDIDIKDGNLIIIADATDGTNSTIVHEVNITVPACDKGAICPQNATTEVERNVTCNTDIIDEPTINRTCSFIQDVIETEGVLNEIRDHYNATRTEACFQYTESTMDGEAFLDYSSDESSDDSSTWER